MSTDDLVGALFSDRYRVLKRLGGGGMGLVYEALDERLRRKVAVKLVRPGRDSDTARARFLREIAVTTRLVHPHIITVFDCGEADLPAGPCPYLVLELIGGDTLSRRMAQTRLDPEHAVTITEQVAAALAAAHEHKVVHGDLKPGNIMLAGGDLDVRLLDFGLSKILDGDDDQTVTQTGILIGTPRYISPEVIEGVRNDPRSDLYALGVILFEMLTGRPPFEARNTPMLLLQHLQDPPPRPSQISTRSLPAHLDGLVLGLLEKDPGRRPQTASDVLGLLQQRRAPRPPLEMFEDDVYDNTETDRSSLEHRRILTPGESVAPQGEVALVVTTAKDGRRLKAEAPGLARQAFDVVEEVLSLRLAAHEGYAFGHQAPQYRFAFPSAEAAVRWCLEVQKDLLTAPFPDELADLPFAAHERDLDGGLLFAGLRLSMGVAFGKAERRLDALTGRHGYVGEVLDEAERLDELAHPGEILVEAPLAGAAAALPGAFVSSVDRQLQDMRLLRVLPQSLKGRTFGDKVSISASSSTNIEDTGPLYGRREVLDRLHKALSRRGGITTIVGPGGTGKTVVAKEVARRLVGAEALPGGVWFCGLAECTDLPMMVQAIAHDVGVGHALGPDTTVDALSEALAHRGPMLLILDNLEQAPGPAAELVRTLAHKNPDIRLLATSREPLAVHQETVIDLGPLDVDDAVELFLARADRAYPGAADRAAIRRVAILLDAMPLAVELAAARTRLMSPRDICARLEERLDFLGDHRKGGRQATLSSAIEWSWNLLTAAERTAFAQCAVFRGGFSLEAAEAVLDLSAVPGAPYVLDVVQGLRDKSLLYVDEDESDIRFDMYRPIKMFAAKKAAATADLAAVTRRHARYVVTRTEELLHSRRGLSGAHAVAEVSVERNNLLSAAENMAGVDTALARRAVLCLAELYQLTGPASQAIPLLEKALAWAKGPVDSAEVRYHLGRALAARGRTQDASDTFARAVKEALIGQQHRLRVQILGSWSRLEHRNANPEQVRDLFEQAAEICAREGFDDLTGRIELERSLLIMTSGDFAGALERMQDALALVRYQGDVDLEYRLLVNIGIALVLSGHARSARPHFEQALTLVRALGDRAGEGLVLGNLGATRMVLLEFEGGLAQLQEAVDIHRAVGDRVLEGVDMYYLALCHHVLRRLDQAETLYDEALAALANVRKGRELAMVRLGRALLGVEQGMTERAARDLHAADRALGSFREVKVFGDYLRSVTRLVSWASRFDRGERAAVGELDAWLAEQKPGTGPYVDVTLIIARFVHERWSSS